MQLAALLCLIACSQGPPQEDWTQWGGAGRDFRVEDVDLADWPPGGPRASWTRELGNGTAGIVGADGSLFTVWGEGRRESVVALDARDGSLRWSRAYDVEYEAHREDFGGPHATPLLSGELVLTVSIDAKLHAHRRADGAPRWERDLVREHDVDLPQSGYAASPLAWNDLVLLPGLGGRAPAAIAFDRETGRTVWARHAFLSSHASPLLIEAGGREHVVFHGMNFLVGLDPASGDLLWRTRLRRGAMDNVAFSPLWDPERQLLVVSHCYDGVGTRALRLVHEDGRFRADELWTNRRLKVEHGNAVLVDGTLYASDGANPAYLVALDLADGATRFKQRGLPKANFVAAGNRLLVLDEEGGLHLGLPRPDRVELRASAEVLEANAWTAPTLVGSRLYLRDRFAVRAYELP